MLNNILMSIHEWFSGVMNKVCVFTDEWFAGVNPNWMFVVIIVLAVVILPLLIKAIKD